LNYIISKKRRLNARGYRQAFSAKFKGFVKKPQGDSTKNQLSDAFTAVDRSEISNANRQRGEHVALQLESLDNDGRLEEVKKKKKKKKKQKVG
jgi:hypothetical protein